MINEFKQFQAENRKEAAERAHGVDSFEAVNAELASQLHMETNHPLEACKNLLFRYDNNYEEALAHIQSLG